MHAYVVTPTFLQALRTLRKPFVPPKGAVWAALPSTDANPTQILHRLQVCVCSPHTAARLANHDPPGTCMEELQSRNRGAGPIYPPPVVHRNNAMEQCKAQRAAAQPPPQALTSSASMQRPPIQAPYAAAGPSQQPQQRGATMPPPAGYQPAAASQHPPNLGPWPAAQQAPAYAQQAPPGQAHMRPQQASAYSSAPMSQQAYVQQPAGPGPSAHYRLQHAGYVPRPLVHSGAVQSGAPTGPSYAGGCAPPVATAAAAAAQVAGGVHDLELDDDWDDADFDALDASAEAHQLQQLQQQQQRWQQPVQAGGGFAGQGAYGAGAAQPFSHAASQSAGAAAFAPQHNAGAYGSQAPAYGGQSNACHAPQRMQPPSTSGVAGQGATGATATGGGGGVFDSTVRPLQGMTMRAQPQRGGEYDKAFPWTAELNDLNGRHFHNPSFRGCQEQVRPHAGGYTAVPGSQYPYWQRYPVLRAQSHRHPGSATPTNARPRRS